MSAGNWLFQIGWSLIGLGLWLQNIGHKLDRQLVEVEVLNKEKR